MRKLLFVNACMRGEESRTGKLCEAFLEAYRRKHPDCQVEEVDLSRQELRPYDLGMLAERDRLIREEAWDDGIFALARQFAQADDIVVGAPYWDLSFPAALKIYVEHIMACGICFYYTEEGPKGMARAQTMYYLTTGGGFIEGQNFGAEYMRGIARMCGIPQFQEARAEGLDIIGMDADALVAEACQRAAALAE